MCGPSKVGKPERIWTPQRSTTDNNLNKPTMALVSYSDSEHSDSEPESIPAPQPKAQKSTPAPAPPSASSAGAKLPSIVDRSNPRKIRVSLPEIKPETSTDQDGEGGPARKKPRIGGGAGGGGLFSGFNSFLPAPKRNTAAAEKEKKTAAPARKVFSLKTGATPGFDREADAEMRRDQALGLGAGGGDNEDDETIPKAGSLGTEDFGETQNAAGDKGEQGGKEKPVEVKLKGNHMMFKPLSVGRTQQKKKKIDRKSVV